MADILVTCPPMLGQLDAVLGHFDEKGLTARPATVTQVLSEEALIERVPHVDGWIIGDDPATERVLAAGAAGRLKACVKWGVGTDNVDFAACERLGLPVSNTPGMFGNEVADVATAYVIGLARQLFFIDRTIRTEEGWPKPAGISLKGRTAGIVGLGDIGAQTARRMAALGMKVVGFDPNVQRVDGVPLEHRDFRGALDDVDVLILTCPLNPATRHLISAGSLARLKHGVRIVNVSRGPIIDEPALEAALVTGQVHSAALDVFEVEPLPGPSPLRAHPRCIFGSHNGSNTTDAVIATSRLAIDLMAGFLKT